MLKKIKEFFSVEGKPSIDLYLKKLAVDRYDLIDDTSFDVDLKRPVNAFITFAILLKEKGEYYKSLKVLESLKEEELSEEEKKLVILNLALVYRSAGFVDRAEQVLREGITLYPTESFFYYELAQILKSEGKLEESVDLLEKAVELKNSFLDDLIYTKLLLANSYIDSGRTDRALRIIRKLKISIPIQFYYYVLSKLFYSVGEIKKGYETAFKGMRICPDRAEPFLEVIEKYDSLDRSKLEGLLEKLGFSVPIVRKLVYRLIEEGKGEKALTVLESLWKRGRTFDPELFEEYIKILWNSGKRKRVAEEVISLLSLLKENKRLYKCESCGFKTDHFDWMCPKCKGWETLRINGEV
ncbi:MAG: hypothetical protein DSZ26_00035 [Thermovibrio sp.]|nr:MAG: hypothetical protein DSZ26_00035 [Thermovibrio sp.]